VEQPLGLGKYLIVITVATLQSACAPHAGTTASLGAPSPTASTAPSPSASEPMPSPSVNVPAIPSAPTGPEITTGSPLHAEDSDGAFRMTIATDQDRYRAGQAIEVEATLTFLGPEPTTVALGSGSGLIGFGVASDDPAIVIGAAFTTDCASWPIVRDEVIEYPFSKSGGWGEDDPLAPFYRSYFAMPELRLPAGTWTIGAGAAFFTGADCGDEPHDLSTSVTVVIEP